MKVICLKKDLKRAVTVCDKLASKNINLPILSNVLINTEEKKISLTSTNLEIGVNITLPAKVEKPGNIIVPSSLLNSLLFSIQDDNEITLELDSNNLIINTINNSTVIKGQPIDDFPLLPKIETSSFFTINSQEFILGLKSVLYACSLSDSKPEISSVYVYSDKNEMLTFVATDSFRLAEKKLNYFFDSFGYFLLPLKTATEMVRIFSDYDKVINLRFNKNQINIDSDDIKFVSRLTDGVFLDYKQVIPKTITTDVVCDRNFFVNSLKISSVFLNKLSELKLVINPEDSFFVMKTSNGDVGENISKIPSEVTGEAVEMVFNHKYIADCLSFIDSEKIILRFSGQGKPLLISGVKSKTFQYLIMPMNM